MRAPNPWPALACALLLLGASLAILADDFRVQDVEIRLQDGAYWMDANIDFTFSETALEALDNGVPLTIELHVRLRREGSWVWEGSLFDYQTRYTIRYKPLSERYSISQSEDSDGQSFVTRDAAIAALGTIRDLRLVAQDRLEPEETYRVHLRVALDIDELPLPLRPIAYLRPSWKLHSKWSKWPLDP